MPDNLVSDRDPRFTASFWRETFHFLGIKLSMSTPDHPQSDGQTERVNRVLEDILRSYANSFTHWSEFLPMAEFTTTGHTPCFMAPGMPTSLP